MLGPHMEAERLAEYNAWFAVDAFDGVAVPFVGEAAAAAIVGAFRELPVSGWHVHGDGLQRDVLRALDHVGPVAARQNKINAIVRQPDGGLLGDWVESPREQFELWRPPPKHAS